MFQKSFIALTILLALGTIQADIQLTTVKDFLERSDSLTNTLVFFTKSKVKKSKAFVETQLTPLVAELSKALPKLTVLQVEATNPEGKVKGDQLFLKHNVFDYPTVKFYLDGMQMQLLGPLTANFIVAEVNKKIYAVPSQVASLDSLKKMDDNKINIIYYTENEEIKGWMNALAKRFHFYGFIQVDKKSVIEAYAKEHRAELDLNKPLLMLAKKPHDPLLFLFMEDSTDFKSNTIAEFIRRAKRVLWTYFNNKSAKMIDDTLNTVLLYLYDSEGDSKDALAVIRAYAESKNGGKPTLLIERSNANGVEFLQSVGFPVPSVPTLYLITKKNDFKFNKYILDSNTTIDKATLKEFVADCEANRYPKHYKSEKLPDGRIYPNVEVVVGLNVDEKVFKAKEKHHLIFFYTGLTANQLPHFQNLAAALVHESVDFFMFNHDKNEGMRVKDKFEDSIVLFSQKLKVEKVFELKDSFDSKAMGVFLKKHLSKDGDVHKVLEKINFETDL